MPVHFHGHGTFNDKIRASVLDDRSQLFRDLAGGPFYGFNGPGAKVSQGLIDSFWLPGMQAGCKVFSGLSHGRCSTHKNQINADLLAFFQLERNRS